MKTRGYNHTPLKAVAAALCVCLLCAPGFPEGAPSPLPPQTTSLAPAESLPPETPEPRPPATPEALPPEAPGVQTLATSETLTSAEPSAPVMPEPSPVVSTTTPTMLRFPTDRPLGRLLVRGRPIEATPLQLPAIAEYEWDYFADALGEVALPEGKPIALEAHLRYDDDLRRLGDLPPDAFHTLFLISSPELELDPDEDILPRIGGLTGLRELVLTPEGQAGAITEKGLSHLRGLQNLKRLHLVSLALGDQGLAEIAHLKALEALWLVPGAVTDAGLVHLRALPNLRELNLYCGPGIRGHGLEHLAAIPTLRRLALSGLANEDPGLARLRAGTQIRSLDIACAGLSSTGISQLGNMAELEELCLRDAWGISDEEVLYLLPLRSLKALDLSGAQLSERGVSRLKELSSLETLYLTYIRLADTGFSNIASLTHLKRLRIGSGGQSGGVTDAGMVHLKRLKGLEELTLSSSALTDAGIARLASLPRLRTLALHAPLMTGDGVEKLSALSHLETLWLGTPRVAKSSLNTLSGLTQLRELSLLNQAEDDGVLDISGLSNLEKLITPVDSDEDLACLAGLKHLRWLQVGAIARTVLTDDGMAHLAGLTGLERLTLSGLDATDAGLAHLSEMGALKQLTLTGGRFTDQGLEHLARLRALTTLEIRSNSRFTEAGIKELREALPFLRACQLK